MKVITAIIVIVKNIAIIILILIVGAMAYFQFTKNEDKSPGPKSDKTTSAEAKNSTTSSDTIINISNQSLAEVPKDIFGNTSLTILDVSNNSLTGSLPAEIRRLSNLEELLANDNKMTGIPAEIGQLSKLRIANFANNDLSGLPLEIGNLKNLETLDLRGNPNVSKYDISLIQPKIPNTKILTD